MKIKIIASIPRDDQEPIDHLIGEVREVIGGPFDDDDDDKGRVQVSESLDEKMPIILNPGEYEVIE